MGIQFCDRSRAGRKGREAQVHLASLAPVSGSILGAYRRDAGPVRHADYPAEASGLITKAIRVQAIMLS